MIGIFLVLLKSVSKNVSAYHRCPIFVMLLIFHYTKFLLLKSQLLLGWIQYWSELPIVTLYWSENLLLTKRLIREVFPTPESPTRITLSKILPILLCFWYRAASRTTTMQVSKNCGCGFTSYARSLKQTTVFPCFNLKFKLTLLCVFTTVAATFLFGFHSPPQGMKTGILFCFGIHP